MCSAWREHVRIAGDCDITLAIRNFGSTSASNNAFGADLAIDHIKVRVLYIEGSTERYALQGITRLFGGGGGSEVRGAYSPLQEALMEDPDVECTAMIPGGGNFSTVVRTNENWRGLPESPSEWFAFDAIILSNVPREVLSDQQFAWVEEWIGRRGGGLCMVGGPNNLASGRWNETSVGKMLPVDLSPAARDWDEGLTTIHPRSGDAQISRQAPP